MEKTEIPFELIADEFAGLHGCGDLCFEEGMWKISRRTYV